MRQVDHRIKKRRDERIRSLSRHRSPRPPIPHNLSGGPVRHSHGVSVSRPQSPSERVRKRRAKFAIQTVLSLLLLALTYVIFQADTIIARQSQELITEVMERDYNFQGVAEWYEAHLGGIPAIIPTFSNKNDPHKESSPRPSVWLSPVQGQVVEHFKEDRPYMTFNGSDDGQVTASTDGLISFVGEKEGWGNCVIVQHAGDTETWYGPVSSVQVELSDWVNAQDPLGEITHIEGKVQFGVKRGGKFVDPLDVITVD